MSIVEQAWIGADATFSKAKPRRIKAKYRVGVNLYKIWLEGMRRPFTYEGGGNCLTDENYSLMGVEDEAMGIHQTDV